MENETDCCMQLAIEGEKYMDNKAWKEAASCLEAALNKQADDPRLTDLICAKLWASYFQMGNYGKSLEYVHHQLQIPSLSEDFEREAQCVVKIGLTLSLLNRFEEASSKFEYLLEAAKSRNHEDLTGIAIYYLAQTNFKLATELEKQSETDQNSTGTLVDARLWQAVSYFLKYKNLIIKDDKGGSPLEGKIYGSLAHVYFKLNQLEDALSCQLKCLQISRQFGDIEIQFSSISFLGTIYCCMQKYNEAAEAFEQSFFMAEQLNDDCRKAKALYRLANTMSMLKDHVSAIQVAEKYLHLVKLNSDDVGENSVYCFLCDQYRIVGDLDESLNYAQKYKQLSEKRLSRCGSEFEFDPSSIATKKSRVVATSSTSSTSTRLENSNDVKTTNFGIDSSVTVPTVSSKCRAGIEETESLMEFITKANSAGRIDDQQLTMERLNAHNSYRKSKVFRTKSDGPVHMPRPQTVSVNTNAAVTSSSSDSDCLEGTRSRYKDTSPAEKLIDQIVRSQSYRMNDQRSEGRHLPQSSSEQAGMIGAEGQNHLQGGGRVWSQSHEQSFLDLLERCQDSRYDDQRTALRPLLNSSPSLSDNQFLDSIQRGQSSGRMEEQRTTLPPTLRQTMSCGTNSSASFLQQPCSASTSSHSPLSSTSLPAGSVSVQEPTYSSDSSSFSSSFVTTIGGHNNPSSSHSNNNNSSDMTSFNSRHVSSTLQSVPQSQGDGTTSSSRNSSNCLAQGGPGGFSSVSFSSSLSSSSNNSSSQFQTVNSNSPNSTNFLSTSNNSESRAGSAGDHQMAYTSVGATNGATNSSAAGNLANYNTSGSSSNSNSRSGSSGNSLFQRLRRGSSRKLEAVLSSQSKHSRRRWPDSY